MKLNIYGHAPLIAPRDPVLPMEAATKNYVDNNLTSHSDDVALHMTPAQNTWMDEITVSSTEVNRLTGVTEDVKTSLEARLLLAGGIMTGALTLSGAPVENLHAATKLYTDTGLATKLNLTGGTLTGPLTLNADPVNNLEASTKQYVDQQLTNHGNNEDLHLTAVQNTWMDSIVATPAEVNRLQGLTSNAQTQIDSKFDKTGGVVSGDINLAENKTVFVSKVPAAATELVNKAYVDARISGQEWKNPITDANLLDLASDTAPASPAEGDTFIAGTGAIAPLTPGHAYTWSLDANDWVALQGRPVAVGDRFGIGFGRLVGAVSAGLTADHGKIITVTDATVGAIAYDVEVVTAGTSTLVFDQDSTKFGAVYSFNDEGAWVQTNTSVNLVPGTALELDGNTLNVKVGDGIAVSNNIISVKPALSSPIVVDTDGVSLPYATAHFEQDEITGFSLSAGVLSSIEDRLSKTSGGVITGTVTVDTLGSLELGYTPTLNSHAVTKEYVDNSISSVGQDTTALDNRLQVLEADPTTKTYVDAEDNKRLSKTGGTMTGFITLHTAPETAMQATNKAYVDQGLSDHSTDQALHLTPAQNTWIDAITATSVEVNYLVGVTSDVQTQVDSKLGLVGGEITGPLTLPADPTNPLEAAPKQYVDAVELAKVSKAGDTMTGALVLPGAPVADLEASTKKYVDDSISTSNSNATAAIVTKVSKAGDTMTGYLTLHEAPTADLHASSKKYVDDSITQLTNYTDGEISTLEGVVTGIDNIVQVLNQDPVTKNYVDTQDASKVSKAGDTMTGYLTLHADPQQALHPASKQYVDALAQGLRVKASVRFATSVNLAGTYNNGASGVGSTLTGSSNAALEVDGATVTQGDRILVKSQTNKLENGDYVVKQTGSPTTPFILNRTTTVDESHEVPGSYFFVFDGTNYKGTGWTLNVVNPGTFTIGTDDITVNQFSGQGTVIAGNGMTLDGNTLNIETANVNRIVINEGNIDLAQTGVIAGTYTKVVVDTFGRITSATKPTSFADLGLNDVQALNSRLTSISNLTLNGLMAFDANGQAVSRTLEVEGIGLEVVNPAGNTGNPKVKSNATALATPDTVVSRDVTGNFAANVITAALDGNASTATVLKDSRDFSVESADITAPVISFNGSADVALAAELKPTGVTAGEFTKVTVDTKGRVTAALAPTAIADLGITDVYTKAEVDAMLAEQEAKYQELFTYVMARI